MRQRTDLMMGPIWVLLAVHRSVYFTWVDLIVGFLHFSTMWKRGWTSAGTTTSPSGQTSWYLPATQAGLTESNKSYKMKNPKIIISCYRRVPGLGTMLTKTAMKDVEEKGVKVGIIFNSFLKSLSLNILLYYVCTYAWDLFVFLVMCVVWCLDIDVNVYLLAKSLWCNNPR